MRGVIAFAFSILLFAPLAMAADGDPIAILSQSPSSGYEMQARDEGITLSFSFSGDYANCSLYGSWQSWEAKDSIINASPASYDFYVSSENFECANAYQWNIFCVEDNNSANYAWGENRTFSFPCPAEEKTAPVSGKKYSVLLNGLDWESFAGLMDRWIIHDEKEIYNLYLENISDAHIIMRALPSNATYKLSYTEKKTLTDIDLDGNGTKDVTIEVKRIYAWQGAVLSIRQYGIKEENPPESGANESKNVSENISPVNATAQNASLQNVTNANLTSGENETGNATEGMQKINVSEDAGGKMPPEENRTEPAEEKKKIKIPLWMIVLVVFVVMLAVIVAAYKMMGPVTV